MGLTTEDKDMKKDFDSWAFEQCVTKGHTIVGVKNDSGINVKYVNTTTEEEFVLGEKCPGCGASEVDAMTPRTVYACGSSDYDGRGGTFTRGSECT